MNDLADGESIEVQGSARRPYVLKNVGGVYSCSCPAWRNQSLAIERRTCKHLRLVRGDAAETARVGGATTMTDAPPPQTKVAAPRVLLADVWTDAVNPTGWWLSEKLDGVRAWWTGTHFLSRNGHRFHAPDWFTAGLPNHALDGELWIGRKSFQRTVSIVRRHDLRHWHKVRFMIFDAPHIEQPFEQRQEALNQIMDRHRPPFAQQLDHTRCRDADHLRHELTAIESQGGEGLMLRQPGSLYEPGRSSTLLKVKSFHDAEAVVVAHEPGRGRHRGRLGALLCALPNGIQFAVGSGLSDAERMTPPPIGTTITFRYQEFTDGGVPRFPSFVRSFANPQS